MYARLCDYCGLPVPNPASSTFPVKLVQQQNARYFWDTKDVDLCSWDCVVMYGIRMGGVDTFPNTPTAQHPDGRPSPNVDRRKP